MTNKIDRTKIKAKSVGARTLAMVLCFVMLLTAIGSGSVLSAIAAGFDKGDAAVLANAVKLGADISAAKAEDKASDEPFVDDTENGLTLSKKSDDADLAMTGAADVYGVKGSWDGWTNVTYFNATTKKCTVDLTAGETYTFKIYSSYGATAYYGANQTFTSSTSEYYFNTNVNDNAKITANYTNSYTFELKREDQGDGAVNVGITFPTSGTTTTTPDLYIYGNINGSEDWNSANRRKALTFVSSSGSDYYYSYPLDANRDHYFRFSDGDNAGYNPQNNSSNVTVSDNPTTWSGTWRNGSDGSQNQAFLVPNKTGKATLWVKYHYVGSNNGSNSVSTWYSRAPYYLTGYIDETDKDGTDYAFANSSGSIWTKTMSFSKNTQYVTIRDANKSTFHPAIHASGSGVKADPSLSDRTPKGDGNNKWLLTGVAGKSVTFTFNATTGVLSWKVTGNNVTVYAKDGAAPINWDNNTTDHHTDIKEGAGATGLSGINIDNKQKYYYNFAAIAKTTMTNGDGTAITGKTTTVCDINNASAYDYDSEFETATLEAGKTIKINTQIADYNNWRSKYYVKGWSINGTTYKVGTNVKGVNSVSDGSSGSYTMYYTIPANSSAGSTIEITPIYYLQSNSNCITFYLEGFDKTMQDTNGWGHTPYAYPFYGNLDGYQSSFGVYPGQPMLYVDGKYSMEVPITSNAIYDTAKNGTIIKGVTVSNGYADHVHRNLVYDWNTNTDIGDDHTHMQTYDYDDFYKIYNEKRDSQGNKPNSIILRLKRETTNYNRDSYGDANNGINWGFTNNDPSASLTSDNVNTIAGDTCNGWELLTDRYGRPVDLFGNVISTQYSADAEKAKPAIRVISTGYNETISGDYGTGWLIYTPSSSASNYSTQVTNADGTSGGFRGGNYTLQTASTDRKAVPPSVFLLASESSFNTTTYPDANRANYDGVSYTDSVNNYKALYKKLKSSGDSGVNALGRYVYVTYEKNAQRIGKTNLSTDKTNYGAFRMDARWYYTYKTDMVNANIKVQVLDTDDNTYKDVAFKTDNSGYNNKNNNTISSTVSGKSTENLKAYFTNTSFDGEVESGDVLINSGDFEFKAVTNGQWVFDSWQIEYDGGVYTELSTSAASSTAMSSTDTLVARFKPLTTGNLSLSHSLSSDSTGSGKTQIEVQVFSNDTKADQLFASGLTTDEVTLDGSYISNALPNLYIQVTLKTTPAGDDKIDQMSGPSDTFFGGTTPKSITAQNAAYTYTFGFKVSSLYNGNTQQTLSLPYYSRISIQEHTYTINYKYPKRGDTTNTGNFTVDGQFTANEYAAYVSGSGSSRTVADKFIIDKAPHESNFLKNLTLRTTGSGCSQSYDTSTYKHTITVVYDQEDDTDSYAIFKLPYDYYTSTGNANGVAYKKYTAKPDDSSNKIVETDDAPSVEIDTQYGRFFTSSDTYNENRAKKVTDASDVNHTGNDFITAPEQIYASDGTVKYFSYWSVNKVDNHSEELLRIYYPDFNYRSYGNYYITPVYSPKEADFWHNTYVDSENIVLPSVLYLGSTRNQWNSATATYNTGTGTAADLIYNDFMLSYGFKGQQITSSNTNVSDCGMIIELVPTTKGGSTYAKGDASSPDTGVYKTLYDGTIPTNDTLNNIVNKGTSGNYIRINTADATDSGNPIKGNLNEKNRMEMYYTFYSQYGQANAAGGSSDGYEFWKNSKTDDYVFRAYAYIKDSSGTITYSSPAYFCMRYIANR